MTFLHITQAKDTKKNKKLMVLFGDTVTLTSLFYVLDYFNSIKKVTITTKSL